MIANPLEMEVYSSPTVYAVELRAGASLLSASSGPSGSEGTEPINEEDMGDGGFTQV